jgi:hypothetical protein
MKNIPVEDVDVMEERCRVAAWCTAKRRGSGGLLVSAGTCGGNAQRPAWGAVALAASSPRTARQGFAVRRPVRLARWCARNSFLPSSPPEAQCLARAAKTDAAAARDFAARPRCGSRPATATNSLAPLRRHCASPRRLRLGTAPGSRAARTFCAKLCKHRNGDSGVEPREAATVGYSTAHLPLCRPRRSMVVCGCPPSVGG